jgi:hypothetical protein
MGEHILTILLMLNPLISAEALPLVGFGFVLPP